MDPDQSEKAPGTAQAPVLLVFQGNFSLPVALRLFYASPAE
jgi:hypothetical protein